MLTFTLYISLNQLTLIISVTIYLLSIAYGDCSIQTTERVQSTQVSKYDPIAHPHKSKDLYTLILEAIYNFSTY